MTCSKGVSHTSTLTGYASVMRKKIAVLVLGIEPLWANET